MDTVWNFVIVFSQVAALVLGVLLVTAVVLGIMGAYRKRQEQAGRARL